ncbi:hypothetical protein, partial [Saccharothrix longispora]|uniref:hypothetical protein n=1 Tax=Saccharothrix longispora TaxID=33920 RepID=UPI0028FD345E
TTNAVADKTMTQTWCYVTRKIEDGQNMSSTCGDASPWAALPLLVDEILPCRESVYFVQWKPGATVMGTSDFCR